MPQPKDEDWLNEYKNKTPIYVVYKSRQEYWSGLPFPSPGDLPDSRIEPASPTFPALAGRLFTTSATWEAYKYEY